MTKRKLSDSAKAAKMIRKELKENGIKAYVRSKNYPTGSNVDIELTDEMPFVFKKVEEHCKQYQYGYYDSMHDLYVITNYKRDAPQAKHVFVVNRMSFEMAQEIYNFLKNNFDSFKRLSGKYYQSLNTFIPEHNDYVHKIVLRVFTGDIRCPFWASKKPRKKLTW